MQLLKLNIIGREGLHDIRVAGEKISAVSPARSFEYADTPALRFEQSVAFPGLINSHDHLEFNLFPATGNKIYKNYVEWGVDIHVANKQSIAAVLKVPAALRIAWGIYKNLLAGITTVVHHGAPVEEHVKLVNVFQKYQSLHSVRRGKNWRWRLNNPAKTGLPAVIHIGEGTDNFAGEEIDKLLRWNLLRRPIIGVHGISMNEKQAAHFKALVWCPVSNIFLYGKSAPVKQLGRNTRVLFGSDSTLTGAWNFWDHLRVAQQSSEVSDEQLYTMITSEAAKTWNLNAGQIETGLQADIVVAKPPNGLNGLKGFYDINPEDLLIVIQRGEIKMLDASLLNQMTEEIFPPGKFSRIYINGVEKFIKGDLPGLIKQIQKFHPGISFPVTFDR